VLYLVAACVAGSVAFLILFVVNLSPRQSAAVSRRLAELEEAQHGSGEVWARRRRLARSERLRSVLQGWGERVEGGRSDNTEVRQFLIQAGYMSPNVVAYYWGARIALFLGLGAAGILVFPVLFAAQSMLVSIFASLWLSAAGWVVPPFYVRYRVKARQKAIIRALPDALDMMVVCVEAGLALNQALVRVSEEIDHVSPIMSEQLSLVNLEIRAGTAREEALRNLGERTGVADIKSLVTMLIQTDRFGTSVATALRVHADTLRTKRRQRAEEAAAKTTIKLLFPLVFFVFPAMFVVILGPALIQIVRTLSKIT
jgi:tight adherence protein C